jgi:GTP:adenosylcobinamide-phosphate guanylyltransferase
MLALILAGGCGNRLSLGEKALVTILGKPMIEYVTDAFHSAGCEVVVVLSRKTPYTHNWCRVMGIDHITASGKGYVDDIVEAVNLLDERCPLFTSVSDIPCLHETIISHIRDLYFQSGKDAESTWVPASLVSEAGCRVHFSENIDGTEACPAGINILNGARITEEQDEIRILVQSRRLAFNVNTREELRRVQDYMEAGLPL